MQCPDCGYMADDAAVFCPRCRFQFREAFGGPVFPEEEDVPGPTEPFFDLPERRMIEDDPVPADTGSNERKAAEAFTEKERRFLAASLLQTSVLVVLIGAGVTWTAIAEVPFVSVTAYGLSFGIAGILSLCAGLFAGVLFFLIARRQLGTFR